MDEATTEQVTEVDQPSMDRLLGAVRSRLFGISAPRRQIGRYSVVSRLGAGGMGVVLSAHDEQLDRMVAIKLLRPRSQDSRQARLRFIREARAMARLSHPNVVQVFEVGECEDGQIYVVMERVRGQNLRQWLTEPQKLRAAVEMYIQAGRGLQAAHDAGLAHRDFKPENVMVGDDGRARVLDFGLARKIDAMTPTPVLHGIGVPSEPVVTAPGVVAGTPAYMAPEAHVAGIFDARSDQFSFCVALYEAMYGEHPRVGRAFGQVDLEGWYGPLRPAPADHEVPLWLREVVVRGLALDPSERWPSMAALLARLERGAHNSRRWIAVGTVLVAVCGTAMVSSAADDTRSCSRAAHERIHRTWSSMARREIGEALAATGHPHADQVWSQTAEAIDDYTTRWSKTHTQVCTELAVSPAHGRVDEPRMHCLERRLEALAEVLSLLAAPEADLVDQAPSAIERLPRVDDCLTAGETAEPMEPPTESQAVAVQELRRHLDRAEALGRLGRHSEGLTIAEQVVVDARALGYLPLQAEAEYRCGWLQNSAGDPGQAAQWLEQAYFAARRSRHDRVARRAALTLIYLVGVMLEHYDDATKWARHARAELDKVDVPRDEVLYHNAMGAVLARRKRYPEALQEYLRAQEYYESSVQPYAQATAGLLKNICITYAGQGRPGLARSYCQRALEASEATSASAYGSSAHLLSLLSKIEMADGDSLRALSMAHRAVSMASEQLGPEHPETALLMSYLAGAQLLMGKPARARESLERALESQRKVLGEEHMQTSWTLGTLALVDEAEGDLLGARRRLQRAVMILEQSQGAEFPGLAKPMSSLARVMLALGDDALAHKHATLASQLTRGIDPRAHAEAQFVLAQVHWARGERREARAVAERARADIREVLPEGSQIVFDRVGWASPEDIERWIAEHPVNDDTTRDADAPPQGEMRYDDE